MVVGAFTRWAILLIQEYQHYCYLRQSYCVDQAGRELSTIIMPVSWVLELQSWATMPGFNYFEAQVKCVNRGWRFLPVQCSSFRHVTPVFQSFWGWSLPVNGGFLGDIFIPVFRKHMKPLPHHSRLDQSQTSKNFRLVAPGLMQPRLSSNLPKMTFWLFCFHLSSAEISCV